MVHLPPIPSSHITVSMLILVFCLLLLFQSKFVSPQTSNLPHESTKKGNEKRFALCLFGKIGNMYGKDWRKGNDRSPESLMTSPTHFEHLILPNNLDVFAHSWIKRQSHIVKLINDTYSPYLKAQRYEYVKKDIEPVQSMMITIWNSLKLMMDYSKEKEINYDLAVLMRYDLFFRTPIDLSKLDSEVFWVSVWCESNLGHFHKDVIQSLKQSHYSLFR